MKTTIRVRLSGGLAGIALLLAGGAALAQDYPSQPITMIVPFSAGGLTGTMPERAATLPDVPTTAEVGLSALDIGVWHGLYVPAGVDEAIRTRLTEALQAALQDEELVERFNEFGTAPATQEEATPDALAERLSSQIAFWRPHIEAAGLAQ